MLPSTTKGWQKPELDRYQAYYCGLCRTLGQKYGLPGQLTLSYDLAFIAILHTALYEPETQFSAGRCAPHPIKARPRAANEFLDYAADMTIALAYYNFLDNWQDDHSRASLRPGQKAGRRICPPSGGTGPARQQPSRHSWRR